MTFDFDALDFMGQALLSRNWIFAKTMTYDPHWYTLRKEWRDDPLFDKVVETLRRAGYDETYNGKKSRAFNMNGMKYWTMGAPVPATILINRKHLDRQVPYDQIAYDYEQAFKDFDSLKENVEVIEMVDYKAGSVLDIGCGTGLFLDYVAPQKYVGIDPSNKMLEVMRAKHPVAPAICTPFEEYAGQQVDLIVSLFASASYIPPEAIGRIPSLLKPGGRYFLMFYAPGYHPVTYERTGVEMTHYQDNHLLLPGEQREYHNFIIVEGGR